MARILVGMTNIARPTYLLRLLISYSRSSCYPTIRLAQYLQPEVPGLARTCAGIQAIMLPVVLLNPVPWTRNNTRKTAKPRKHVLGM